ncbi:MAG TPA: fasciclin domain-containing protein [Patescibacteria group bacterium]|nr:fasciclin domain-containing protein [Patescibacteria group bacterium]
MTKHTIIVLMVMLCVMLVGCQGGEKAEQAGTEKTVTEKIPAARDIVDIAVADGRFTTLVAAVRAADLVEILKGKGPFTVFAPTDDAFAKLPPGTVEALLEDIPKLKNILLYHVVPGKVMAADVVKLESADTAMGKPVKIEVMGDHVMVNNARVIITDIEASNGVIHVIDTVILPPEE